jgi:hypothetical protein
LIQYHRKYKQIKLVVCFFELLKDMGCLLDANHDEASIEFYVRY